MMVADGYPGSYAKGNVISNLDLIKDSLVFHAGTKHDSDGNIVTNGGRVIAVTSFGDTIESALKKSYDSVDIIDYKGKYYRKDIGKDLLK